MNKKRNNKGFSLVELIVVIAVMAVLVVVLAPAYLRYVEKSRVQKDVSAVSEVVNAVKIAASEEAVYEEIGTATIVKIAKADGTITVTDVTLEDADKPEGSTEGKQGDLYDEIVATVGEKIALTSDAATGSSAVDIEIKVSKANDTITAVVEKGANEFKVIK